MPSEVLYRWQVVAYVYSRWGSRSSAKKCKARVTAPNEHGARRMALRMAHDTGSHVARFTAIKKVRALP
jgi:hypothetical protein